MCSCDHYLLSVSETELRRLQIQLQRSREARLRAWVVLQGLREILQGAGEEIRKVPEKSFAREGEVLERALKKALSDREAALSQLAQAARWIDRCAFGKESDFGQAHQALLKALDQASSFL